MLSGTSRKLAQFSSSTRYADTMAPNTRPPAYSKGGTISSRRPTGQKESCLGKMRAMNAHHIKVDEETVLEGFGVLDRDHDRIPQCEQQFHRTP